MNRVRAVASLLLFLSSAACEPEELTQIVVVVDGDWDGFERIRVEFDKLEDAESVEADLKDQALPRRVALVHDGGPLGPIDVTVSGFAGGLERPVIVEPRTGLFFERGKTLMLKVDLFYDCVVDACPPGEACLGTDDCVRSSSSSVTKLGRWTGDVDALGVNHRIEDGDALPDWLFGDGGVSEGDAGPDGGVEMDADVGDVGPPHEDGAVDTSVPPPPVSNPIFSYVPSNFDPAAAYIPEDRVDVLLDCTDAAFDSTDLTFGPWCGSEPAAMTIEQSDGTEAVLVVMDTLTIRSGTTLRLTGDRPVILAVFGGVRLDGGIDVGGAGSKPGAGGGVGCDLGQGSPGAVGSGDDGCGGGGGGSFASAGAAAGDSGASAGGIAGTTFGEPSLVPLRGGCPGGAGAGTAVAPGGGGGGAVQVSAADRLELVGFITAGGGGGAAAADLQGGGGGGGSGGAILLEGAPVFIDSAAEFSVGGGGGGGGEQTVGSAGATAGADGLRALDRAPGGDGPNSGGSGGQGAAAALPATAGQDGDTSALGSLRGGGGGGGGGVGRIRINQADACMPRGKFSPAPSVDCPRCGDCSIMPALDCQMASFSGTDYALCAGPLPWLDAQSICMGAGMMLARIDSATENSDLTSLIDEDTWVGATDAAEEGVWTWEPSGDQFWSGGSFGSSVGGRYEDWGLGEPSANSSQSDCAIIRTSGGWNDVSCSGQYAFLCEGP